MIDEPQYGPTETEPKLARNAPCPCGSGRKYKKCCGVRLTEEPPAYAPADRETAIAKLARFAYRPQYRQSTDIALGLFFGNELHERSAEVLAELATNESLKLNFRNFQMLDFEIEDGRTILDLFLESKGPVLNGPERRYLEGLRGTCVSLYEIQEVVSDEGLRLRDLWDHEEIWVSERLGSRQLVAWDLLAARVMQHPGDRYEIEGDHYLFPADAKDRVLRDLKREHQRLRRKHPNVDKQAFFKRAGFLFNRAWMAEVLFRPPPQLVTPEGDHVVLGTSVYDVLDRARLVRGLDAEPALRRKENGHWSWTEPAPGSARHLGWVRLKGRRLVLDTASRPRLERLRALIKSAAPEAVRHRSTRYEEPDWGPPEPEPDDRGEEPVDRARPEITTPIDQRWLDDYYRRWVDEPVPALGGRTPRHAATLKTQRPRLIDLLKDFENRQARASLRGGHPYDFGWLWRELGLERPP
jgi:hypothetical protein